MNIFNEKFLCRNTDHWTDDTLGTNSLPTEVSTTDIKEDIYI